MNRKLITSTLIFLLIVFLLTGGYFGYQLFGFKSTKQQLLVSDYIEEGINETLIVNPNVFLDGIPFELILDHKQNDQESYTKILLENSKQTIILHKFDKFNPCLDSQIKISEDLVSQGNGPSGKKRFLIKDQCGDYIKRHLITLNHYQDFDKQDPPQPSVVATKTNHQPLELGDIYLEKLYRVIGWADHDNLIVKEIAYQNDSLLPIATHYYLVNVDNPRQKELLK